MEDIPDINESPSPRRSRSSSRRRSQEPSATSTSPKHVKSMVLAMLKMKSFVGVFKATQRVDCLGDYRDVIEAEEGDPIVPLMRELQVRIRQAYPNCWPGITVPGNLPSQEGNCFWVEHGDKVFEPYHFRIIDIQFTHEEVKFIIRAESKVVPPQSETEQSLNDSINNIIGSVQSGSKSFAFNAWQLLTKENIVDTIKFLAALVMLIGTATVYLLDYLIRLMHAFTAFVKVSMPAILKVLDIVQKTIGAIFVFLAMLWRDIVGSTRRPEQLDYNRRALRYK